MFSFVNRLYFDDDRRRKSHNSPTPRRPAASSFLPQNRLLRYLVLIAFPFFLFFFSSRLGRKPQESPFGSQAPAKLSSILPPYTATHPSFLALGLRSRIILVSSSSTTAENDGAKEAKSAGAESMVGTLGEVVQYYGGILRVHLSERDHQVLDSLEVTTSSKPSSDRKHKKAKRQLVVDNEATSNEEPMRAISDEEVVGIGAVEVQGKVEETGLGKDTGLVWGSPKDLIKVVESKDSFGDLGRADLVVLSSCELDMPYYSDDLLKSWEKRDADDKFIVACISHDLRELQWVRDHSEDWASRGSLRVITHSEHLSSTLRTGFSGIADEPGKMSKGFDHIPIFTHIPTLPLKPPVLQEVSRPIPPSARLTNAAIIGEFSKDKRDYDGLFDNLRLEIEANPLAWGYKEPAEHPFTPNLDPNAKIKPFFLHLVGDGDIEIPGSLTNLVKVHTGLTERERYNLLSGMDIILPTFNNAAGYFEAISAFTVATSLTVEVPILSNARMLRAYPHIDDPRISVVRPHGLRESAAIRVLRAGTALGVPLGAHPNLRREVVELIKKGWKRGDEGEWKKYKRELKLANLQMIVELLRST